MRAFYHPVQAAHGPQQFMRYGRVVPAHDLPARVDALLGALRGSRASPFSTSTRITATARSRSSTRGPTC